jgi:sialic acid synthase SpsE
MSLEYLFKFNSINSRKKTFIIGEVGSNHNLDKNTVKKLIDNCSLAKFDSVKFQIYDAEEAFSKHVTVKDVKLDHLYKNGPWWEVARDKILMPRLWFKEMFSYARSKKLIPICTVHREEDAHFLISLGLDIFKIASIDMNHKYLLKKLIKFNKPMIISTGMGYMSEISDTVDFLRSNNFNNFSLLHCISQYPPKFNEQNLKNITMLRDSFSANIGYSDHSTGSLSSIIAVTLGANIIEKHITLDQKYPGPDHPFALDKDQMKDLVSNIRNTEKSLGKEIKNMSREEIETRKMIRRSIVLKSNLKKGDKINLTDLKFARPGTGINPNYYKTIIGRVCNIDIKAETILTYKMLV